MREDRWEGIYRRLITAYIAFGLALAGWHAVTEDWYLMAQSLGTMAALGAVLGLLKRMGIRPVYSCYSVIVVFLFASYTLGVACALYKVLPGYDKVLHMLSGTLTMMLALPLFYALKHGHRIEQSDCLLAVGFCLTTALAVAGVWEMAEFAFGLVTPLDPQCVQATGVTDTMKDMLVCTLGALMALPQLFRFYRTGEGGWLFDGTREFVEKNLISQRNAAPLRRGEG